MDNEPMLTLPEVSLREWAHMLAALRVLQHAHRVWPSQEQIATEDGHYERMTSDEIDDLCERLNTE